MSALVNNLLDMARIESGEVKLRRQWHPFEEVVGSALKAAQAALAGHRVESTSPRDLPLVEFDATLIERVLYNLLENAVQVHAGRTLITIAAGSPRATCCVSVSDTGPGIPKGQEEAIFEKFTRGARESATPGVGLGLAICRAIVEAHRGRSRRRTARTAARDSCSRCRWARRRNARGIRARRAMTKPAIFEAPSARTDSRLEEAI